MNFKIIYNSRTGNTQMLAETITSVLNDQKRENDTLEITNVQEQKNPLTEISGQSIYFIGFWTDKGGCGEIIANILKQLENCRVFLFGTAGFGQSQAYFDKILGNCASYLPDSSTLIGTYMCQGKMPVSVRSRYEAMLEKAPGDPSILKLIDNFDSALEHPNTQDQNRLADAVRNALMAQKDIF